MGHHNKKTGMDIGLYTLADLCRDPSMGRMISPGERLNEIIEAAKLADEAGLDIFGVGEHHRLDYAVSSPVTILSAISQKTKKIKLTSATSVLNTVDPVRLFEEFAMLDLLSRGRAEIITGRGAFLESFPLFGYKLDDYDELFEENLQLLVELNKREKISWEGKFRSPLKDADISPRPYQEQLPLWVGVGGSEMSAARAGKFGVGLILAILGGDPSRFQKHVDIYRRMATHNQMDIKDIKVGVTGHAFISDTTQHAKEVYYPYYSNYWETINQQHGMNGKVSKNDYAQATGDETALFVGSSQQVIEKILHQHELFGHERLMVQIDIGGMPFKQVAKNIEFLAMDVIPGVRKHLSK